MFIHKFKIWIFKYVVLQFYCDKALHFKRKKFIMQLKTLGFGFFPLLIGIYYLDTLSKS